MQRRIRQAIGMLAVLAWLCAAEGRAADKPASLLFLSGRVEQKPPGDPSKYRIRSFLPDAKLQPKLQQWGYTWWAGFFSTQHRFAKPEKVVHRDWIQRFGVVEGRGMLQLDTAFEDKQI